MFLFHHNRLRLAIEALHVVVPLDPWPVVVRGEVSTRYLQAD